MRVPRLIAGGTVLLAFLPAQARAAEPRAFTPREYRAEIRPDLATRSIAGTTEISFERTTATAREISIPTNGLVVTGVRVDGGKVPFTHEDGVLRVAQPAPGSDSLRLAVDYHGEAPRGLVFGEGFVYSVFDTCRWMICDDDPGVRAPITMEIVVPAGFEVVASGGAVGVHAEGADLVRHEWREERPYSAYLYGFAAGRFAKAHEMYGAVDLRYLGPSDTTDELCRKFERTAEMLAFFEDKAGVPLPHAAYTQVLVPGGAAQEMSSFSVLGRAVLDPILESPHEDWAIAHELAHQWWGNLLTCRTWRDFWLNEGITVFMVAAYKEHKWGKADYDHELELCRTRHQRAKDAGFDKPLRFEGPYPDLRTKRAVVYYKGALFMAALREAMGDAAFWSGFKAYTQEQAGRSVETADFKRAMEAAAGRSLDGLFAEWVE